MERDEAFALIATRHFVPEMQASRETIIKHRGRRRYCTIDRSLMKRISLAKIKKFQTFLASKVIQNVIVKSPSPF